MSVPGGLSVPWSTYVALGDSLTTGRGDTGPGGRRIGWARRLAGILSERTAVPCTLTNLATDGAALAAVLGQQLPSLNGLKPDLASVTVGMNDIRAHEFDQQRFADGLGRLLDVLAATGATVLTCTIPDISGVVALPPDLVDIARERMRQASDTIREQARQRGVLCLDLWERADAVDPGLFGADRIHPNASGHRLMASVFADMLLPG
jgi:lysophospholipase L1-like esterase